MRMMQERFRLAYSVCKYSAVFFSHSRWLCARLIWVLAAVLVVFPGSIFSPGLANEIDAVTAYSLSKKGELVIVDVRRSSEWRKTGMPATSHGISLQNFLKKIREDFTNDIVELVERDVNRPIALICATGGRSAYAMGLLREAGFSRVFNIGEGMLGDGTSLGWIARSLPLRKCDDC